MDLFYQISNLTTELKGQEEEWEKKMKIAVCIENLFNSIHYFLDRLAFEWETEWCQTFSED